MEEEVEQNQVINISKYVEHIRRACLMLELSMSAWVSSVLGFAFLSGAGDSKILCSAAVFLATKVCEEPRRVRDVINSVFYTGMQRF